MSEDPEPGQSLNAGVTEAAVELLANPTRLRIVDALGKQQTTRRESQAVGFAELQRLAGAEDSGNFAYHLNRLSGALVVQTDAGYRLSDAGSQVSSILHSPLLQSEDSVEVETDYECGVCGATIVARTTDGCIEFHCGSGHGFRTESVPGPVLEESVERALKLALGQIYTDLETMTRGHCPRCNNQMRWGTEAISTELGSHLISAECSACAMVCGSPVTTWALVDWDIRSRLHLAGIDLLETPLWDIRDLPVEGPTRVGGDEDTPPEETRFRLRFEVGDATFTVEIDGTATVLSLRDE
ncbi:DUF7351 domain-containing protein [Haloarchaeobius amylolyticus]|uniref:DUF7351 domain-containing protein n=1 Tax=Haloarchaeobius amylolyticus TaxID=1198296 RepID=UPI00226FA24A|nr:hypothetical protein [Haloarchaeobius amylolyticus]